MNKKLYNRLKKIAEEKQTIDDPSHDFEHIKRVLNMAIEIGQSVNADLDIIIPSALFHDIVVYRKDSLKSKTETEESAELAGEILKKERDYPQEKIENVKTCIKECSFSKGIKPNLLESKVLQDADLLESTGAISIMRTFSSGGQMKRSFYNKHDPFYKVGEVDFPSGIGLFYRRLLVVQTRIHTQYAKDIAKRRTKFLREFLRELKIELKESRII